MAEQVGDDTRVPLDARPEQRVEFARVLVSGQRDDVRSS